MIDLLPLYNQLREIAHQADEQRLSVFWDQLKCEFPEFTTHMERCAQMPDAKNVLRYLTEQDPRFLILQYAPQAHETITFILNFFKQRTGETNVQPITRTIKRTRNDHRLKPGDRS